MVVIYHNPRCSKSRKALAFLEKNNIDFVIQEYIVEGLTLKQVKEILKKGDYRPEDIIREKDSVYKENVEGKLDDLIQAILKYPTILQRPIIVGKDSAVIARDDEALELVRELD
jgi:arsenate reductase (glutaredoxin)